MNYFKTTILLIALTLAACLGWQYVWWQAGCGICICYCDGDEFLQLLVQR